MGTPDPIELDQLDQVRAFLYNYIHVIHIIYRDFQNQQPEPSVEDVEKMFEEAISDENFVEIWAERVMYAKKCADDETKSEDYAFCRQVWKPFT